MATPGPASSSSYGGSVGRPTWPPTCKLPGCSRPRYSEPNGFVHDCCGRTHAELYRQRGFGTNLYGSHHFSTESSRRQNTSRNKPLPLKASHTLSLPSDLGRRSLYDDEIRFYNRDDPYYEFTNFYHAPIRVDGKDWPTSEHYFQAQKFVGTPYAEKIRKQWAPREAFQMSRDPKVSRWRRGDWEKVKDDIMLKALYHKFEQHDSLRKKLLGTGDKKLIEHTFNDSYWGDGGNGTGLNRLGKLLMRVRQDLRLKYGSPAPQKSSLRRSDSFSLTRSISPPDDTRPRESKLVSPGPMRRSSSFSNLADLQSRPQKAEDRGSFQSRSSYLHMYDGKSTSGTATLHSRSRQNKYRPSFHHSDTSPRTTPSTQHQPTAPTTSTSSRTQHQPTAPTTSTSSRALPRTSGAASDYRATGSRTSTKHSSMTTAAFRPRPLPRDPPASSSTVTSHSKGHTNRSSVPYNIITHETRDHRKYSQL